MALRATEQPIDTGTASGKAFLVMPGVFTGFGTNLRRERQREGIAPTKARGVYRGRRASVYRLLATAGPTTITPEPKHPVRGP